MSERFGRYEARTPLGRGGMGLVWRGHDPLLDRAVAIKELKPARELPEKMRAEYRERFFREARAAARLQHPGIVAVHDVGLTEDDRPYLVMELIDGESLDAALRSGSGFTPEEAARIGAAVARALECAHRAGVVHRDVKPANVLRAKDGSIKLMDFGIARLADSTLTQDGIFLGSPQYSAPEQVRGVPPDGRADLFSLGLLVYILLAGKNPFARATLQDTVRAIVQDPAPAPSSLRPELGAAWDEALLRALARDPAARHQDATELAAAFEALARSEPRAAEPGTAASASEPALELVVVEGPAKGRRVRLDRAIEVGRDRGDLMLGDATVSGRHCRIEPVADGRIRVTDLGSTNGTWHADQRVTATELGPGDSFRLGTHSLLRLEAVADTATPAPTSASAAPAGTVLDGGPTVKSAAPRPLAGAARFALEVKDGPLAGQRFPLTRSLVLGRDEGDLVLGDAKVSRKHAMVELRGANRVFLRDLASSNGTWLGSERVREVELRPGDEFRVGDTRVALAERDS